MHNTTTTIFKIWKYSLERTEDGFYELLRENKKKPSSILLMFWFGNYKTYRKIKYS